MIGSTMDGLLVAASGLCGGLVAVIWNGLVTQAWLRRLAPAAPPSNGAADVAIMFLAYGLAGAVLGLLYWLGWGLAALHGWRWPAYGVAFGLLAWTALPLPTLVLAVRRGSLPRSILAPQALEWLIACVAAGVFSALGWQRLHA